MTYVRKTRDRFDIEQFTGRQYGWECVNSEESIKAARQCIKEYRDNQPEYPVRIVKRREPITEQTSNV